MNRGSIVIAKNFELEFLTDLHVSIPRESKKAIFKKCMYVCLSVSQSVSQLVHPGRFLRNYWADLAEIWNIRVLQKSGRTYFELLLWGQNKGGPPYKKYRKIAFSQKRRQRFF